MGGGDTHGTPVLCAIGHHVGLAKTKKDWQPRITRINKKKGTTRKDSSPFLSFV
jgi:hypothetical protein